ncbi:hypothetical protein L1887_34362 [Cichorium endivia]|nr:hypothetical protein L1887_34362 [Cichorium endivia]
MKCYSLYLTDHTSELWVSKKVYALPQFSSFSTPVSVASSTNASESLVLPPKNPRLLAKEVINTSCMHARCDFSNKQRMNKKNIDHDAAGSSHGLKTNHHSHPSNPSISQHEHFETLLILVPHNTNTY